MKKHGKRTSLVLVGKGGSEIRSLLPGDLAALLERHFRGQKPPVRHEFGLAEVHAFPPHLRVNESYRRGLDCAKRKELSASMAWDLVRGVYYEDAISGMYRGLSRLALAAAWYQSEKGTPPAKLEDLVPKYLSLIPTCPFRDAL